MQGQGKIQWNEGTLGFCWQFKCYSKLAFSSIFRVKAFCSCFVLRFKCFNTWVINVCKLSFTLLQWTQFVSVWPSDIKVLLPDCCELIMVPRGCFTHMGTCKQTKGIQPAKWWFQSETPKQLFTEYGCHFQRLQIWSWITCWRGE